MQISNIDLYIDRLSACIEEDKEKMGEQVKVYRTLAMMTGVMYLASVLIYPIASTAPGDAQNSVPMWLFLGCMVLFPKLLKETEEI